MFKRLKTIMIVDDSKDFLMLFRLLLERFNFSLLTASNGLEAIQLLEVSAVDLIITDFRMPLINGVELLNWCRSRELFVPVILTTAEDRLFEEEEVALGDCCATLLRKPIDVKLLHAALEAAENFDHHTGCLHSSLSAEVGKIKLP